MKYELIPTRKDHSHLIDALAYRVAVQEANLRDEYLLIHIKKKPWWLPEKLYRWILSGFINLTVFKK